MGSEGAVREVIEVFGDPDELAESQELIVLILEEPWTDKGRTVPKGMMLGPDSRRLCTSEAAFRATPAFLTKQRFSAAAFAGCAKFDSSQAFLDTAKSVLQGAHTLVLVHNRNQLSDLLAWFPDVSTLVLHHDLALHTDGAHRNERHAKPTRLQRLLGTTPALGADHLLLDNRAMLYLFSRTSQLKVVRAPMQEIFEALNKPLPKGDLPKHSKDKCTVAIHGYEELVLGCTVTRHNGNPLSVTEISPAGVAKACHHSRAARYLQMTASSEEAFWSVGGFCWLTHVDLTSTIAKPHCSFEPNVPEALSKLPLKHLSLTYFNDVGVSAIGTTWRDLEFLAITACAVRDEEIASDAFPKLKSLLVGCDMKRALFFDLLRSCPGLVDLRLERDKLSLMFLTGPRSPGERPRFDRLERLTLRTSYGRDCSLVDKRVLPSDLDSTLSLLPALRRVRTDSYKIRFHVNFTAPQISLDWCSCTICFAEFPKVDAEHQRRFTNTHYKAPSEWHVNIRHRRPAMGIRVAVVSS